MPARCILLTRSRHANAYCLHCPVNVYAYVHSFFNDYSSDVKAADLIGRFTKSQDTPASRRVPSFTSTSLSSSLSDIGPHDTSMLSAPNRSGITSTSTSAPSRSLSNGSYGGASESGYIVPASSGSSAPIDLRHRGDNGSTSDSTSDDDEAYESPEEFLDAQEEVPQSEPAQTVGQPTSAAHSDAPLVASFAAFTPADATKMAVPVASDTQLQADLRQIWYAISLFLNSQFAEAQAICTRHKEDRLYYALGSATLSSIKALMSFEPDELAGAVEDCKKCLHIADKERNNWPTAGGRGLSWSEKIAGGLGTVTRGSSLTVEITQRMSILQRHAELAYAECLLM